MRRLLPLAAIPLLALATACAEAGADPDAERAAAADAAVRSQLEQANARFAERMNQGDIPGAMEVYTEDAKIFPPDAPTMQGVEAITGFWQAGVDQLGISNMSLTTEEVEVFGNTAWEQGRASFDTGQGPATAKFIVVWKRGDDGQWRWHRDIWNMDPAGGAAG